MDDLVDIVVTLGMGKVRMTPALVPTHSKSLQASSDVIRKQAVLCCLIMSSESVNNFKFLGTGL